jgi:hypothetical protein
MSVIGYLWYRKYEGLAIFAGKKICIVVPSVDYHTAAGGPMAGKTRRMGRPGVPGGGIQIKLRVDSAFVQRIDDWRAKQGSKLSRPRAVELLTRMALEMFAGRRG